MMLYKDFLFYLSFAMFCPSPERFSPQKLIYQPKHLAWVLEEGDVAGIGYLVECGVGQRICHSASLFGRVEAVVMTG